MRPNRFSISSILFLVYASACSTGSGAAVGWRISPDSAGPIAFGMSPAQAAAALGLKAPDSVAPSGCELWRPAGAPPGLSLMVEDGRVVRVDVDSPGVATVHDLQVGSLSAAVRTALGPHLVIQPHKYQWEAGWQYLSLFTADSARGLVFEVDSHVVRTYRAGLWPQVGYVEHCS